MDFESLVQGDKPQVHSQVVFLDIEKYSKRKSSAQLNCVNKFTKILKKTIQNISEEIKNFSTDFSIEKDLIKLPTGDGVAIVFAFSVPYDTHFKFSKIFLDELSKSNFKHNCEKFNKNNWCNCHSNFYVRIAINEGISILYKDINGSYNIAGKTINNASRLLNAIEGSNQILLSENSYEQLIEFHTSDTFNTFFKEVNVKVKHSLELTAYLYLGEEKSYPDIQMYLIPFYLVPFSSFYDKDLKYNIIHQLFPVKK